MTRTGFSVDVANEIDKKAHDAAERFISSGVTRSQIRQIYDEIRQAQAQYEGEDDPESARTTLILLKPKLAYQASRDNGMDAVREVFREMIAAFVSEDGEFRGSSGKNDYADLSNTLDDETDELAVFFELAEAIVGYHRYEDERGRN